MVPTTDGEACAGARVGAVLLAAGESSRMGTLKALLPWSGRPLLEYQVQQLLDAAMDRIVVVLGHRAGELHAVLPRHERVDTVLNPDYASGKVGSIVAGVDRLPPDHHVLVLGVDQPRPAPVVGAVAAAHCLGQAPITIAGCAGRRGHPVLFAPSLRDELLGIEERTQGLRAVLQRHAAAVQVVETGAPIVLVNLNTREDYAAALATFSSSTTSARAGNQ